MSNSIVIINPEDIPYAVHAVKDLSSYATYVFDPVLIDKIGTCGLQNVVYIPWDDCLSYCELDTDARAVALCFENELERIVQDIIPDISIVSWQSLNLYHLFTQLKWYAGLWARTVNIFTGKKVHFFVKNSADAYYFNSFVPSCLLMRQLERSGVEYVGYLYGSGAVAPALIPSVNGIDGRDVNEYLFVHLPTCFYDWSYICNELSSVGKNIVNIESEIWNFPIPDTITLPLVSVEDELSCLSVYIQEKIAAFVEKLTAALDELLAPYFDSPTYRALQVQHLARRYRSQLVFYYRLIKGLDQTPISQVILSDHDAGFHGPLISFSKMRNLPVTLLPHSKFVNNTAFKYNNMSVLNHPAQAQLVVNADGKVVKDFKIAYPEHLHGSIGAVGLKKLFLLLNAFSLNGIYYSRYEPYVAGIRKIISWAAENGIELKIRCKKNYTINHLVATEFNIDESMLLNNANESIDDAVKDCDVCLMYDAPTSGALKFLGNSIPILNPVVEPLTTEESAASNNDIVPQESIDKTIARLSLFVSDPLSLFLFRHNQFIKYVSCFRGARPLRAYV